MAGGPPRGRVRRAVAVGQRVHRAVCWPHRRRRRLGARGRRVRLALSLARVLLTACEPAIPLPQRVQVYVGSYIWIQQLIVVFFDHKKT